MNRPAAATHTSVLTAKPIVGPPAAEEERQDDRRQQHHDDHHEPGAGMALEGAADGARPPVGRLPRDRRHGRREYGDTVRHMTGFRITGFDHLVLRCADVDVSLAWYVDVLGLPPVRVEEWRAGSAPFPSVRVSADAIIDLVPADGTPTERNVDHFCLVTDRATVDAVVAADGTTFRVVDGPGTRFGARGDGWSVYVVDPDDNVVELRSYD